MAGRTFDESALAGPEKADETIALVVKRVDIAKLPTVDREMLAALACVSLKRPGVSQPGSADLTLQFADTSCTALKPDDAIPGLSKLAANVESTKAPPASGRAR